METFRTITAGQASGMGNLRARKIKNSRDGQGLLLCKHRYGGYLQQMYEKIVFPHTGTRCHAILYLFQPIGSVSPRKRFLEIFGYTLVELMISIAIVGALAAIAIPNYISSVEKARTTKVISEMKMIEKEILLYAMKNEGFPDSLADVGMDRIFDLWGNPYQYLNIAGTKGQGNMRKDHFLVPINSDFDLYSMGPDGRSASPLTSKLSRDDIIRASNGKYFGIAAEY
jgi:general secretion pathway protein G